MLPVSPNEPKQRTTGATVEQIEAAAKRYWDLALCHECPGETWEQWRDFLIVDYSNECRYIVPPGLVIAPASDVLTGDQRAALGHLERFIRNLNPRVDDTPELFMAQLDLLRAIADGGAK